MAELVGIINYGIGNIRSVFNALEYIGLEAEILEADADFGECSHLILPGVGAYAKAMKNITASGIDQKIRKHVFSNKPLLGICLGMQLLSISGEEGVDTQGLGFIEGEVRKMDVSLHIPHVGWNNIKIHQEHPILENVKRDVDFYFVHSYQFQCEKETSLIATTDYEKEITAIVAEGSVVGTQFHPEKSQTNGLKILENFCNWDGC
jgi:glutamine amidotransferase